MGGFAGSCLWIIVQVSEVVVVGASCNAGTPHGPQGRKSGAITQRLSVPQWPAFMGLPRTAWLCQGRLEGIDEYVVVIASFLQHVRATGAEPNHFLVIPVVLFARNNQFDLM